MMQLPPSSDILTLFLSQVFLSLPFLLVGTLISSTLLVFLDEHKLEAHFPRNRILSSMVGSGLGLILPLGQVGIIPVVRRLLLQGAPLPLAISALIAAPTLNLVVILGTLNVLGDKPRIAFLRIILTWLMAIAVALIFSSYREKPTAEPFLNPLARVPLLLTGSFVESQDCLDPLQRSGNLIYEYAVPQLHQRPWLEKLRLLVINTMEECLEFGAILIITSAIAALIQALIPQGVWLGEVTHPLWQTLLMMGLGFVFSLGVIVNTTFIVPYLDHFWSGALLAFLLMGAVLNLKSLGLLIITFRPKPLIYLVILLSQLILFFTLIINYYLP
jgi:uncharacterized membrane protein YraQ (UPF0718 family)